MAALSLTIGLVLLLVSSKTIIGDVDEWVQTVRDSGLAMTSDQISILKESPTDLKEEKKILAQKYIDLKQVIKRKRIELSEALLSAEETKEDSVLQQAELYLIASLEELLIPIWMGGLWHLNGIPGEIPDLNKPVACGHFIQKLLTDVDFNIQKYESTWLAYLSPNNIIKSITGKHPPNYENWENLIGWLHTKDPGMYIIGVECKNWATIMFGRYYGNENLLLMHSGPHRRGASVKST